AQLQAEILNFYDPDRAQAVLNQGEISTWDTFLVDAQKMLADQKVKGGAGIRILTETIASPLLRDQIQTFLARYPKAKWYQYDPCGQDGAKAAAMKAFGRPVNTIYDLKKAKVIVSLDGDFLFEGPGCIRYARDFADGRRVMGDRTDMNRLYAIESWPTITGSNADHRFRVRGSDIEAVAMQLATAVGVGGVLSGQSTGMSVEHIRAIARDLTANKGAAVVIPGANQTPLTHAMCHAINAAIGALGTTALLVPTMDDSPMTQADGLKELVNDLNAKQVDALVMIGGNPVYNAPTDFQFGNAMKNCPLTVHHGLYADETSDLCTWHLPLTHFLEQWGDVRAYDGTISLIQPLIAPLFDSRSAHQLLGHLLGGETDGYTILHSAYKAGSAKIPVFATDYEHAFKKALNDGVIAKTAYEPLNLPFNAGSVGAFTARPVSGTEVILLPDPTIGDGRYSNNGWLQELAKPLTKSTWENCIMMSPAMAQRLNLASEDGAEIVVQSQSVTGPVWVMPGHPDNSITVHLGYGRSKSGAVGTGIGFNAYTLRHSDAMSFAKLESIVGIGAQSMAVASTQIHSVMEGRDIVRLGSIDDYRKNPTLYDEVEAPVNQTHPDHQIENESMYPDQIFDYNGPQWGMTVDLNTCIGCNACVIACQAENNIPVVGKDQVKRGREMQWIRIDRYYANAPSSPNWGVPPNKGIQWD
ncbi:MAG TPA: hypothetical protein VMI31_04765, partial [Fimbriimonadaceae bacterium]|nr:hypothetical protein [Fimbriimonadaceae bacterium]